MLSTMTNESQDWLLVTVSTPSGGPSTLRVYAWRKLRSLGAHYLQQSVCVLPSTPRTLRAVNRLLSRLRADGGQGELLRIQLTDVKQAASLIEAFQRERNDEYREVVERTHQFHQELEHERQRGRASYTELEESDADLARHQKWLAAIRARDYFNAPGADQAALAVAACEQALAEFEAEALSAELDHDQHPRSAQSTEAANDSGARSERGAPGQLFRLRPATKEQNGIRRHAQPLTKKGKDAAIDH